MKVTKTFTIEEKLLERLSKFSIKKDRSQSWIINEILDQFFNGKSTISFNEINWEGLHGKRNKSDTGRKANK